MKLWKIILGILGAVGALFAASSKSKEVRELKKVINENKKEEKKVEKQIKKLEEVTHQQIANAFNRNDLIIYTNPEDFKTFLFSQNLNNKALLLMSSGNYGGLNFNEVKELIV